METRTANEEDIAELCKLLETLFDQEAEFKPNEEAQRKGLLEIVNNSDIGDILVMIQEDRIVAMVNVLYTVSTALGSRVALLEDMVVSPTVRGQGIGSDLIHFAIEHAQKRGCRRITLLTDDDNFGAHEFYQRVGFTKSPMIPFRLSLEPK